MKDLVAMLDEHIAHREAELSSLRRARELLAAHKGETTAPGSTGGEPPPKDDRGRKSGARARPVAAGKAEQALKSARPVAAEKAGPPGPRRAANKKGGGVPAEKLCSRCEKKKPASAFPLRPNGALQSWCRGCYKAYDAGRRRPKPAATSIAERDAKPANVPQAQAQAQAPRLAARAPEETPAERLKRKRANVEMVRQTERASRVPVRCKLVGPDGKACGAVVMSHKATQHAYEVHKKNVPVELMGDHFERAPAGAEAA